jgi:hypothetical protein
MFESAAMENKKLKFQLAICAANGSKAVKV